MPNIFDYTDFRAYLRDCYEEKKRINGAFSYEVFTRMAGFDNRGFLFNVIHGTRKITKSHCYKISGALAHTKEEAEYFENIVALTLAKKEEDRDHFLEKAMRSKGGAASPVYLLKRDQYEYFTQWHHNAIYALVDIHPFKDDYRELCSKLIPSITVCRRKNPFSCSNASG
jgi:uncharacterized protein (TIGR02147 family)